MARRLASIAFVLAAGLIVGAWIADRTLGRDVLLYVPHDPSVVELNRSLWSEGDPVGPLYGSVASRPVRVLLVHRKSLLRPDEDPSLALLPAGSDGASRPLQTRTLWLIARLSAIGLVLAAVAALALAAAIGRRQRSVVGATVRQDA